MTQSVSQLSQSVCAGHLLFMWLCSNDPEEKHTFSLNSPVVTKVENNLFSQ